MKGLCVSVVDRKANCNSKLVVGIVSTIALTGIALTMLGVFSGKKVDDVTYVDNEFDYTEC